MKTIKTVKAVLATMLAVSSVMTFVACGKSSDQTETTAASAAATTQVTEAATTATEAANAATTKAANAATTKEATVKASEIMPLIARTKNSKGNASDAFVKSLKGYTLNVFWPWEPSSKSGETHIKANTRAANKAVEDEFGVKINEDGVFLRYNENLAVDLAAGSAKNQVYMVQDGYFTSFFQNNYMADLSMAGAKAGVNFKDPWYSQSASAFFNINNKQYAWIAFDVDYTFPYCIVYNKNHLKKAKLTDPQELAKKGQWTWAKLTEYAKKLNGKNNNATGFGSISPLLMLETMCQQKGTSLVNVKKGAQPKSNISNQTVKECMSTLASWCSDSKSNMICDIFRNAPDWKYAKAQFAKGKVSMMFGSHDTIKSASGEYKMTDPIGIVQFPTEKGTKKYTNITSPQFACFVPSQYTNTKKYSKDEVAKILFLRNEMYRQNYRYSLRNFSYDWTKYFKGDQQTIDYACNMKYARGNNTTKFSWLTVCEGGKTTSYTIVNEVLNSTGSNIQSAITKHKDSLDKGYNKIWSGFKITGNV